MKISKLSLLGLFCSSVAVSAANINIYVDAAPNAYGSPNFDPWKTAAFEKAANGTFINMEHSFNPANSGTTKSEIEDMVVYSFGDLGKRLHFVYWVPSETIATLTTKHFQLSLDSMWDGTTYHDWAWYTPSSWIDYDADKDGITDGVMGTAGFAYWGAYGVNTQAALDADLAAWRPYQNSITFFAQMDGDSASLSSHQTPDASSTLSLLGLALSSMVLIRRKN